MSSRSDRFECRWQASRVLLAAYVVAQALALTSVFLLQIPFWAKAIGVLLCLWHGVRYLRQSILLIPAHSFTGLRRDSAGWELWSEEGGWQSVRLRPDSIALPSIVLLRFKLMTGSWMNRLWIRSVCVPGDAIAPDTHRRLRLRLKFSRRRWAAPE